MKWILLHFFVRGTCDWMSWMRSLSINRNIVVTSWEDSNQNCDQLSDMTVLILQQVITLLIIITSPRLTVIAEIFYILSGQLVQFKSTGYQTEPYFTWTDLTFWILWSFWYDWRYELVSAYFSISNRICGVRVSVLALSVVDRGFDTGRVKPKTEIGICCFSA